MDKSYLKQLKLASQTYKYYDIGTYLKDHGGTIKTVPYTIRILLEEALRHASKDSAKGTIFTSF